MIIKQESHTNRQKWFMTTVVAVLFMVVTIAIWQRNYWLIPLLPQPITVLPNQHFSKQPVKVRLATPLGGKIRYTLDGSIPSVKSDLYQQPIQINETTLIKMAVFSNKGGQEKQISKSQSYDIFIDPPHQLPIVSLSIDPNHLWDEEIGIYVLGQHENYRQRGEEWERPATLRWYEPDHRLGFEQKVGLRIHGLAQRSMPQKSFRIYVRNDQGQSSRLTYPLFGEQGNQQHSSFILRNGSSDAQYAMMRDRLAAELVAQSNSNLDSQAARPVVAYLNGQYWGLYYLRERFDETYFAEKYRVDPRALAIVEVPLRDGELKGQVIADNKDAQDDAKKFNRLLADMARCKGCLPYFYLDQQVDVSNLTDYLLFEMFYANFDWPYNNIKAWRYESEVLNSPEAELVPELDGRWRWLLFDVDVGFGTGRASAEAMINAASGDPYAALIDPHFPFRNLFYDTTFQKKWLERVKDLTSSTLSAENMLKTIDELQAEIEDEMPRHVARWGSVEPDDELGTVSSVDEWQQRVELLKVFVSHRPDEFIKMTEKFLQDN